MKVVVEESNIGVADRSYIIEVKTDNKKDCAKKLKRYLENFYEDTITFMPRKNYFEAFFVRNGGKLKISYE